MPTRPLPHPRTGAQATTAPTGPVAGAPAPDPYALRYAALDLDGTLPSGDGAFLPQLPAALARLRSPGLQPLLITGRSPVTHRTVRDTARVLDASDDLLLNDGNVWCDRARKTCEVIPELPWDVLETFAGCGVPDLVAEIDRVPVAVSRKAATAFAMANRILTAPPPDRPDQAARATCSGGHACPRSESS